MFGDKYSFVCSLWIDRLYFPLMLARVGGMGLLNENVASYFREMVVRARVWWEIDHKEREIGAKWLYVPISYSWLWRGGDSTREYSSSPIVCLLEYSRCLLVVLVMREVHPNLESPSCEAIEYHSSSSQQQQQQSSLINKPYNSTPLSPFIQQTPHYDPS